MARQLPDHEALVSRHQGLRYTYRELQEEVNRFARGLMALGVRRLDRVGIWSPNNAEWVITQLACAKIGCILVTINPAYRTSELEYALEQTGIPVPFYHCFGMVLSNLLCVTHGATMVLPAPSFDPQSVLETVQEEACTALHGVPTMFIAELACPDFERYDLSTLRTGVIGGAPCPIEVLKQVIGRMHMNEIAICYGMTETSPISTQTSPDDPLEQRVSTVGQVHPHVELKIVDPATGAIMPREEPGELCSRGYIVMLGYWNNPEATASAIDPARWMHTGDLAIMDEQGYIRIVGRIKDMIIRGGENVYPREIEEFLYTHAAIRDVQVIGVPDATYGEAVMAWVILKHRHAATENEIRDYCRGKIAHYKVPRYVKITDGFPMTVTGKIQKFKMREMAVAELGLSKPTAVLTA